MTGKLAVAIVGIGLLIRGATSVVAHHSFAAQYDASKPIALKGVVTRIELTNPHAHCVIDVKDDAGNVTGWILELASPRVLATYGWRGDSLHVGDEITVEGAMAKDGSKRLNARAVTLADGRRLSAGSSGGDLTSQ